jgi:arabinosaccharide transport system substrate-binding protein
MRRLSALIIVLLMLLAPVMANGGAETESEGPVTLTIWTFDQFFQEYYETMRPGFEEMYPNVTYEVQLFEYDALYERLNTIVLSGGQDAPDIIDVESGKFGDYMRGPMPFLPLSDRIREDGYEGAISPSRLSLYSKDGENYGLEHQLVPVTISYRADLFEQAGIDVEDIETWDDFLEAGLTLKEETGSYIIGFNNTPGGINGQVGVLTRAANRAVVGPDGNPDIDNPVFIDILRNIRAWVKDYEIAAEYENWQDFWAAPAADEMVGVVTADWTANALKSFDPDNSGLYRMMAIPRLNADSSRISVWGGTGLAGTVYTDHPEETWNLLAYLQLDEESVMTKFSMNGATPPNPAALDKPEVNTPDEYFGGQVLAELYAEYVDELPVQRPAWWLSLYDRAFEDHFFDFWEGNITAEEFAARVQQSTEDYIASEE